MCIRLKSCGCGCCSNTLRDGSKYLAVNNLFFSIFFLIDGLSKSNERIMVGACIGIIINAPLLYGVKFNKPGCIRGWLLLSMIQIVLIVSFLTIVLICSIAGMVKPEYKTTTAKLAAVFGVSSGALIYFWMVVYSFYQKLKEGVLAGQEMA